MEYPTVVDAVAALRPGAKPVLDFDCVDHGDGSGAQLVSWRHASQRPSEAEIKAALSDGRAAAVVRDRRNAAVKAEARRRILTRYPEWKQVNMTARGVELVNARVLAGRLSPEEQAETDAMQAAWGWVKAVRLASDALEAMTEIPDDYTDDKWWPT